MKMSYFRTDIVKSILIVLIVLFPVLSCREDHGPEKVKVDFTKREEVLTPRNPNGPPLMAAVSAMISAKETFSYYSKIFDYLGRRLGRRIMFKQRKTYQEVNDLLRYRELDFAFICSGAYIEAKKNFNAEILAVPQIDGKTSYHAYIIVRDDSGIARFEDLEDRSFAFTDPLSNTGCLYPRYAVLKRNRVVEDFFSRIVYTNAHDYSIQAVRNMIVDGASVDSLVFEHMRKTQPPNVQHVKVLEKSEPFGIPPIVAHPKLNPELKESIRSVLLAMDQDPQGKEILSSLFIDRFVMLDNGKYDSVRRMRAFLESASHEDKNS